MDAADDEGYTPLLRAAENLDKDLVSALINYGASVNACTHKHMNALHIILNDKNNYYSYEAKQKCITIAKMLIDCGIDMNAAYSDETALHMSLLHNDEITKYLILKGTDVNNKNKQGQTILHQAIKFNKREIIKLLLQQ